MKALAALAAAALLALVWGGPLETWLGAGFVAHMVRHITVVAIVPPLAVLAAPGLARRFAPAAILGAVIDVVVVWGWHLPALHDLATISPRWRVVEQASFLLAGLAVWGGAFGARHPILGAGTLLLTSMHMTLLGALIVLSPRLLYADCSALSVQQTGGILMLAIGTPAYLLGGVALAAMALREPQERRA